MQEFLKKMAKALAGGYQTGMEMIAPKPGDLAVRAKMGELLASATPGIGDAMSGYDAVKSASEGNYGDAALNGVGLLPFVPALAGMTKAAKYMPPWADDLIQSGGRVNPDGTVTLFHRTTPDASASIRKNGKMTGAEDGLFFSTKSNGQASGYGNDVVEMNIPASRLQLDDIFEDEAHFKVPLSRAGEVLDVSKWIKK